MSNWTHMATGILLAAPAFSALLAVRIKGSVKPAYTAVDARRSMDRNALVAPVSPFDCASRGKTR
jgi:hypothetical protein